MFALVPCALCKLVLNYAYSVETISSRSSLVTHFQNTAPCSFGRKMTELYRTQPYHCVWLNIFVVTRKRTTSSTVKKYRVCIVCLPEKPLHVFYSFIHTEHSDWDGKKIVKKIMLDRSENSIESLNRNVQILTKYGLRYIMTEKINYSDTVSSAN